MYSSLSVDWLQLYVDCSSMVFDSQYTWKLQGYQTKQFRKVYIISYRGEEFGTAVHEPTSSIIPAWAMIVKLSNRQLYGQNLRGLISSFLEFNGLVFKGVTRIDIALDFNKFKGSLDPHDLIKKFLKSDFLKNGRGKFSVIGEQKFENSYQYLRFGSKTSEVNVYLYNKSIELQQVQDKPYIRKLWALAGIDEMKTVWRLEISLKSKGTHFVDMETGEPKKFDIEEIGSENYLKNVFYSFANQYFEFKYNDGTTNKTRMQSVILFDKFNTTFKPLYLPETTGGNRTDKIFLKKLHALDQELRGFGDVMCDAQKTLILDFVEQTGLSEFYEKKKDQWNRDFPRPE